MLGTADPTAAKSANEAVRPAEEQMEPRAWGRGKCEAAKHAPNTGSGRRVTGAGLHTEGRKRKEEGEDHRSTGLGNPSRISTLPRLSDCDHIKSQRQAAKVSPITGSSRVSA